MGAELAQHARRAERLRELHSGPILILPNVWDSIGAMLLESLGYPAVATASAAVSWANGYSDGECMPIDEVAGVVGRIARATALPLSVDLERGYGDSADEVSRSVELIIGAGGCGINIEDSLVEGGELRKKDEQCGRIAAAREAAERTGVPIFINARVDLFLGGADEETAHDRSTLLEMAIERGTAYVESGADGLYPIGLSDVGEIEYFVKRTKVPVNILAHSATPAPADLQKLGVCRVSLGPGLLKTCLGRMRAVAETLLEGGSHGAYIADGLSGEEVNRLINRGGEE